MKEQNPMRPGHPGGQQSLETLQDIKMMMERSTRFISLSGLSGIAAGICALAGSYIAKGIIDSYYKQFSDAGFSSSSFHHLKLDLLLVALFVLVTAWVTAFYFTWRKARHDKQPVWNSVSKRLTANMFIPLVAGGVFILAMLQHDDWHYVSSASLIFYGLALVNASKYTLTDVRYLGFCEIILGLVNTQYIGYGLYFWAMGFGVLHIIYGFAMWWKYEKV